MASKSKRRRRVLGASCILAALIIAASSFAWFTSKDEVTNRLTANADYGVSIVESFAPPANWLPGQTVNKDVYAVNTGNVDAFVKETVSGVLDYTFEKKVNEFSADCLELTSAQVTAIDGVTTNEGGGFLAWTDAAGVNVGAVNSARQADGIDNTWKPSATGTYIFRRSIKVDTTGGNAPTYKYAGYYFVKGDGTTPDKYYKIVIGNDDYRAASEENGTAGAAKKVVFDIEVSQSKLGEDVVNSINPENGVFTVAPKIAYVKDQTEKSDVVFTYDGTNHRLIVNYSADAPGHTENGITYDASAWAARTEVDYNNKLGEFNKATVEYEQAKADNEYASALATARDKLKAAAERRKAAYADLTDKNGALGTAWGNLIDKVNECIVGRDDGGFGTRENPKGTTCYRSQLVTMSTKTVDNLFSGNQLEKIRNNASLTQCKDNIARMNTLWGEMVTLDGQLWDAIKNIAQADKNASDDLKLTPSDVQGQVDATKRLILQLKDKMTAYSDAYSAIVDNSATATELGLNNSTVATDKGAINGAATNIENLYDDMDSVVDAYKTAYSNNQSSTTADDTAQAVWEEAINNYNNSVSAATAAYKAVVTKPAPNLQPNSSASYADNSAYIVPYWSMMRKVGVSDPEIKDGTNAGTDYYLTLAKSVDGFTQIADETFPYGSASAHVDDNPDTTDVDEHQPGNPEWKYAADKYAADESSKESAYNDAKRYMGAAKGAYEDAKAEVTGSSTITIYVNLADDIEANWTRNTYTDGTKEIEFYLRKILDGGKTSAKLVDSVEFANTVSAKDYKNLTFDLNVGLRSAQITFDEKGAMTSDAVLSPDFNMSVGSIATDGSKAVTWITAAPPAATNP